MKLILMVAFLDALSASQTVFQQYPIIRTNYGSVAGSVSFTKRNLMPFASFLNIPYAKPPVADLRFKAPQPPDKWTEVRSFNSSVIICPQFNAQEKMDEDCLYLNVYTPINLARQSSQKPVMVFIHGGAFVSGSGKPTFYGPDFFVDQDVLLVTFNYRIGALGFLTLQNEKIPGNAGLKDQALALKWVQENIEHFGGDPARVTIFGQSAGAASVNYHLVSRTSRGLYSRAILQSGSALDPWAHISPSLALSKAHQLATLLDCTPDELDHCFMTTPLDLLIFRQRQMMSLQSLVFVPTMEKQHEGAFLTEDPVQLMSKGDFNKVPTIIGSVRDEGMLILPFLRLLDPLGLKTLAVGTDLSRLAPPDLKINGNATARLLVHKAIKRFYFNGNPLTLFNKHKLFDLVTDVHFFLKIQQTAHLLSIHSNQPIYNYFFTFDGKYAVLKKTSGLTNVPGVCHSDDLAYLFRAAIMDSVYDHSNRYSPEEVTLERVTEMWANFAKTGRPTFPTRFVSVDWPPYQKETRRFLEIGQELDIGECLKCDRILFWKKLYEAVEGRAPYPDITIFRGRKWVGRVGPQE